MNQEKFESLNIEDARVEAKGGAWLVIMHIRNMGTTDAKISHVEVNGTIMKDANLSNAVDLVIPIQTEADVWVKISNPPYERGTTAVITIYTTKGNRYIQYVILPEFGMWEG